MEIQARLIQLDLFAAHPRELADFYHRTFGLEPAEDGAGFRCTAQQRQLLLLPGPSGQLSRAVFEFNSREYFNAYRESLASREVVLADSTDQGFSVSDPENRLIEFRLAMQAPGAASPDKSPQPSARLQHFAVRTPAIAPLLDFYVERLGFVLSDRVHDGDGQLTAAFLRTDAEHHAMALFRAPEVRFDHFSCEADGWLQLRNWADHMAAAGVGLAWGVGRHGPGNDNFFMVRDPEGNLGEISCDLEQCEPDRPAGTWPHRPQTLNRWGLAIMRS